MKPNDAELIERCLAGSKDSFGELVSRYQSAVYGTAYHCVGNFADAQDLAQEAFLRAYLHLSELREPAKFASWLRQITWRVCLDWLEKQRRRGENVPIEAMEEKGKTIDALHSNKPSPAEQAEASELRESVQAAIRALPENYREPLILVHIDGLTYKEVASYLDLSVSTVKWRLYHARRLLKKEMIQMVKEDLGRTKLSPSFTDEVQQARADLEECKARLLKIGRALIAYRHEQGEMPLWLSDLVPQYLSDPADLICPTKEGGQEDVKLPCSYHYTFRPQSPYKIFLSGAFDSNRAEMETKLRFYGSAMPMVSCWHTMNRNIFLSYEGEIYEGGNGDWHKLPQALSGLLANLKNNLLSDPGEWWRMCRYEFIQTLWLNGRLNELIPILRAVLTEQPQNAYAHWLWGKACLAEDKISEAFTHYELATQEAQQVAYNNFYLQSELGESAHRAGRFDVAIAAFRRAIELPPGVGSRLYQQLAASYKELGDARKVQELVDEFTLQYARHKMAGSLGAIYQAGRLYPEAIEMYRTAIDLSLQTEKASEMPFRTRGVVEERLVECYRQTGQTEEAEALQAKVVNPALTLLKDDAWEGTEYALRLRWVEVPVTVKIQGDKIEADGSEPDEEFIAKLNKTVPGAQLRYSVILPLKKEQSVSTLLPIDLEPYHACYREVQLGRRGADGRLQLHWRHHRECEGLNAENGWGERNTDYPVGSTYLMARFILTLDNDMDGRHGAWRVRKDLKRTGAHNCAITDMNPEELHFDKTPQGARGFYLFLTILTVEQAKDLLDAVRKQDAPILGIASRTCATVRAHCSLAENFADKGESDKIHELVTEFARQYTQRTAADSLGNIYKAGGQYERAIDAYKQVLAFRRDSWRITRIQFSLMECYEKIGKLDEVEDIRSQLPERAAQLIGLPAPDFCLKDVTAKEYRLSDFRGQVVLLSFFDIPTGCPQALPIVERLHQKYKEKGVTVLGLTKEIDVTKVQGFMRDRISYPVLADAEAVAQKYGAGGLARYIIDQTGIVRHWRGGVYTGMAEVLAQKLNSLLRK